MRDYKNIKAFQHADGLAKEIYRVTKEFPKEEIYGLTSQIRRAAVSACANIVEGASRQHKRDYLQFLFIARGSLAEVEYLFGLSRELNYLNGIAFEKLKKLCEETACTLFGLIESVQKETKLPAFRSLVYGLLSLVLYL